VKDGGVGKCLCSLSWKLNIFIDEHLGYHEVVKDGGVGKCLCSLSSLPREVSMFTTSWLVKDGGVRRHYLMVGKSYF
jgi:hypothetical protein